MSPQGVQSRRPIHAGMMWLAIFLIVSPSLFGLQLEPLTHTFGLSTADRVHTFRITNTQSERIAVRVRAATRTLQPDGTEVQQDASDRFLVFPRQATLAPGASQAVRVQYTGPGNLQSEVPFRLIAEQLPVRFDEGSASDAGIRLLFRFVASLYVRPDSDVEPDVVLAAFERIPQDDDSLAVRVDVENRGTAHAVVTSVAVTLRHLAEDGRQLDEIRLEGEQLEVLSGANLLAGALLQEIIPVPPGWSSGSLDVSYDATYLD